jgi:hypothetical protein
MGEIMENLTLMAALAKALGGGGGGSGGVSDVQVNGTSVVNSSGVANVPIAASGLLGVIKPAGMGVSVNLDGEIYTVKATSAQTKAGTTNFTPIVPSNQHESAFYGLAKAAGDSTQSASSNAVGTYTETAKSKISGMLNAPETVSGSTPSITAKPGVQYICGEVSTIDITVPESGIIDVIFESGSTPAVLTVTPPTGVTIVWPDWFDPTALEANKVYEVNIANGRLATVMVW